MNANAQILQPWMAIGLLDKALEAGIPKQSLRWRLGRAQRTALLDAMAMYKSVLLFEMYETGAFDSGMFCGVPFIMDPAVSEDTVILEQLHAWEEIDAIHHLGIPVGYGK